MNLYKSSQLRALKKEELKTIIESSVDATESLSDTQVRFQTRIYQKIREGENPNMNSKLKQNENGSSLHSICHQFVSLRVPRKNNDGTEAAPGRDTEIVTIKIYNRPPNEMKSERDENINETQNECNQSRLKASWEAAEQKFLQDQSHSLLNGEETQIPSNVNSEVPSKSHCHKKQRKQATDKNTSIPTNPGIVSDANACENCAAMRAGQEKWVEHWERCLKKLRYKLVSERIQYEKRMNAKIEEISKILQNNNAK